MVRKCCIGHRSGFRSPATVQQIARQSNGSSFIRGILRQQLPIDSVRFVIVVLVREASGEFQLPFPVLRLFFQDVPEEALSPAILPVVQVDTSQLKLQPSIRRIQLQGSSQDFDCLGIMAVHFGRLRTMQRLLNGRHTLGGIAGLPTADRLTLKESTREDDKHKRENPTRGLRADILSNKRYSRTDTSAENYCP